MIGNIKHTAQQAAERSLLAVLGLTSMAVGVGFLTHAAWVWLELVVGAVLAAQILGGVFLLSGGGMILASRRGTKTPDQVVTKPDPPKEITAPLLAEAFMVGMSAGQASRR